MINNSLGETFKTSSNNFNLIRLLAAFSVIYGHANAITGKGPGDIFVQLVGFKFIGGVAVDVFFVISGFLITASALGSQGLRYYIVSRALRIYPALIVCVIFTVFVVGVAFTTTDNYLTMKQTWSYLWVNASTYSTEYFLPGVFETLHDKAVNGSLWSLAVEVRLYVIVLFLAVVGVLSRRSIFNALFFGALIAGFLNKEFWSFLFEYENHKHVALMFMIGSFAWVNRGLISLTPGGLLTLFFLAAITHGTASFGLVYNLLLPYLVLYVAFAPGAKWFNRFGDYSYGVYLYGWLSQQLVMSFMPAANNLQNTILGCLLAFFFAVLSWHFVESPTIKLKGYFRRSTARVGKAEYV
jgi:peptidoglycan/LPS O-acetylase OafA/YrhL